MPLMPRRRCRNSWQQAGRRHFGQLVADPYENEAVGETKLAATLARHDRKPQVTAALDVTKSGNLQVECRVAGGGLTVRLPQIPA
jgi:hypothetical protein